MRKVGRQVVGFFTLLKFGQLPIDDCLDHSAPVHLDQPIHGTYKGGRSLDGDPFGLFRMENRVHKSYHHLGSLVLNTVHTPTFPRIFGRLDVIVDELADLRR